MINAGPHNHGGMARNDGNHGLDILACKTPANYL